MNDRDRPNVVFVKEKAEAALAASAGMVAKRHMVAGIGTVKTENETTDLYWLVLRADQALRDLIKRCEDVLANQGNEV